MHTRDRYTMVFFLQIDGDKYEMKEENGKLTLVILDCNGDDEGKYTCKAKDAVCDCELQVKGMLIYF